MSQINILIAEDFGTFREFACRELQQRPGFQVVAVGDGRAAVEAARDLQPHIVVLDIRLPKLDGLAAARRIRSLSPASRIVFLTQESSPDIVHVLLKIGARGYIHKMRAKYLLPAVDAILNDGKRRGGHHHVQFHGEKTTLLGTAEHFLRSALEAHDAAIVVATQSHLRELLRRLRRGSRHVDRAIEQGSFVYYDADELASHILVDGVGRFRPSLGRMIGTVCAATGRPHPRLAIWGECASTLMAAGHIDAAAELEQLGEEILNTTPADILCGYPLLRNDREFKTVCAHHDALAIR